MSYFDDLINTIGLLILWLGDMVWERRYIPLDVFLFDRDYIYAGWGVWEKYR